MVHEWLRIVFRISDWGGYARGLLQMSENFSLCIKGIKLIAL